MNLLVATGNEAKLAEIRQLLSDLPFTLLSLTAFPAIERVKETGSTFVENASLKAIGYALQTNLMTLADDSGLEVDALGGAPGVNSARFAGEGASDIDRISALLTELRNDTTRTARFVSAIVIANGAGRILNTSIGICEGRIGFEARGSSGFGYDPIFVPEGYNSTFAELGRRIKNEISHRSRALRSASIFLRNLTGSSDAG